MSPPATPVPLTALLAELGDDLQALAGADPAQVAVTTVELLFAGDGLPDPQSLVFCPDPGDDLPGCAALVVRPSQVAAVAGRVAPETVVVAIAESARWLDTFERTRAHVRGLAIQHASGDLFDLADALATAVGGAVAVEDIDRRILAFSTVPDQPIDEVRRQGILGRRVPEHVERDDWYRRLWKAGGVVEFPHGPQSTPRLAIALRLADESLGSVWVVGDRATLNPDSDRTLQESAMPLALAVAHTQRSLARSREHRAQLLAQLLSGSRRMTQPSPSVLVAVDAAPEADGEDLRCLRLADVLGMQAQRTNGTGLAAIVDGVVYAVLPWTDDVAVRHLLTQALRKTGLTTARATVSAPVTAESSLPSARQDVDRLLTLTRQLPHVFDRDGQVAFVATSGDQLMLAELALAVRGITGLHSGIAAQISDFDAQHHTHYEATLRAWCDSHGDANSTAALLHIHVNTLRYRLSRAARLFALRLDDADSRLLLHLQLRLRQLNVEPDARQ